MLSGKLSGNHTLAGQFCRALFVACVVSAICCLAPALSSAAQVTLAWDANTEPDLAGYKLYYGISSGSYQLSVDVGNRTSYTALSLLEGQFYYFAAKAYDSSLNESGFSNELSTAATASTASGPVGYWKFDEGSGTTAADSSGNSLMGTLANSPTWTAGQVNGALAFNGSSSYVEALDADILSPGTEATFSAWVFLNSTPSEIAAVFDKMSGAVDDEYLVGINSQRQVYFSWQTTAGPTAGWGTPSYNQVSGTGVVPLSLWTHIAVVRSGTTLTFYINGNLDASLTVMDTNAFRNGITTLRLGGQGRGWPSPLGRFLNGSLDEMRLYNRALSASEVFDLFTGATSTADTSPPTVSLTAPTSGSTVSGTLTVSASASDDVGVAGVQFKLDGANLGAEVTGAPYAVSWTSTTTLNGAHTLTAVARDAAGNTATSSAVSVTVANDTTPPVITSVSAFDISSFGATITWATNEASDSQVEYGPTTAYGTTTPLNTSLFTAHAMTLTGLLANSTYHYRVKSKDAAGNLATSADFILMTLADITPPAVSITAPTSGSTISGTVTIAASATDNVGVVGVQFKLDGANLEAEDTTNAYSLSWNTTTASNGTHTLTAVARDAAGNTATSSSVTVTISNDITPPSVPTNLSASAVSSSQITLSWTASTDNVGVAGYTIYRGASQIATTSLTSYSDTGLSPSTAYTYTVAAYDAAGNVSAQAAPASAVTLPLPPPSLGLVAAYGLNEGSGSFTVDTSSNSNTGTLNGAAWTAAGKFGNALAFNGSSSHVEALDADILSPGTEATFSAWVFLNSTPSEIAAVFDKMSGAVDDEYLVGINSQRQVYFSWQTTAGPTAGWGTPSYNQVSGTGVVPLSLWTHIAVVRSGTTLTFYINGNLDASLTVMDTNAFRNGITTLRLGGQGRGWPSPLGRFLNGSLDEMRIYNRALSQAEIQDHMNTPIGAPPPDTTPPTVSLTAPSNGATVSGNAVTVSATASDNVWVAGLQFKLDGANLGAELTTAPYTLSWNTATAANGTHTLTAVARDAAGNTATSSSVTVTVSNDTTPPTVSLTAPAAGSTVAGTVTVSADASDNLGVVGVQFKLDGVNLGTELTVAPYVISWNTATSTKGSHSLTAVARDAAGNSATSTAVSVTVDNAAPLLSSVASTSISSSAVTITWTTDEAADSQVEYGLTSAYGQVSALASPLVSSHSVALSGLSASTVYHYRVKSRDAAGNLAVSGDFTFTTLAPPDTTVPSVSLTAPAPSSTVSGTVTVSASATDNVGVVGVQFKLDGINFGAEVTAAPYSISWNTTGGINGSHTLTAVARDAAGNLTTAAAVTVMVDNAAPVISAVSSSGVGSSAASITWTTNEASDSQVEYGLTSDYGQVSALASALVSSHSVALSGLSASTVYHYRVKSRDAAGNLATSADFTFTTAPLPDTTLPTVSMTAPAAGAPVAGTVSVSASATDNVGVVGVQFKLDGANLGAEVTAAPYSLSWDTTLVASGSHSLTAVARDAAGNTATASAASVTVDNAAPVISAASSSSVESSAATITWTTNEASDSQVEYGPTTAYGQVTALASALVSSHSVGLSGLSASTVYHYRVKSKDAVGNLAVSGDFTFTTLAPPDTTVPTVSLTAPVAGVTVTGTITVSANATDNVGVIGVQFKLDGVNLGAEVTAAPYSLSWNTTLVASGSHSLTAVARDAAGNTTTSTAVAVTVDNAAPVISAVSSSSVGSSAATITWTTNEASDSQVEYGLTSTYGQVSALASPLVSSHSVALSGLSASTMYHYRVKSRDAAGNLATSADVTFTTAAPPDTTPPTVSMTAPVAGATIAGTITISASATDNVGVVGVQFKLNGVNLGTELTVAPYVFSWNTATTTNGAHSLTAVARDAAGNTTPSAAVSVTVDNALPLLSSVASTTSSSGAATITWTTNEASDSQVEYGPTSAYGQVSSLASALVNSHSVGLSGLSASTVYHYRVKSKDAVGNLAVSVDFTFTTLAPPDTTMPTVSLTAPASGVTVAGTVSVSASATDNVGVVGVQFKLDGVNLGAEVTAAPYTLAWITTTASNGTHSLTAVARDAAGNTVTASAASVTVDNAAPVISAASSSSVGSSAATITWMTDEASDSQVEYGPTSAYGQVTALASALVSSHSVGLSGLSASTVYHYRVKSRDVAGNLATSADFTFTTAPLGDATPPTVSIVAPAAGSTVSGTVTVLASAMDNVGVVGVQFKLDGVNLGTEDTVAPYTVSWNTTLASKGTHTLTAVARDAAGNTTTSSSVTVTVTLLVF